jgi:hypothetical protein
MLLYSMTHNRFSPSTANLVTSQNQWVPHVIEYDGEAPFSELAARVHAEAFNALKYGCYDVDAAYGIRDEFNRESPGLDRGFHFNAMVAPPGEPGAASASSRADPLAASASSRADPLAASASSRADPLDQPDLGVLEPPNIEWYEPIRATGAAFYMIVRAVTTVTIIFRVSRPEFDQEALATALASIQDTLTSAAGATVPR